MGRVRARCKLGFVLNTQVHHSRDEPGIVGAAIYGEILNRPALKTQSPEQGGGCRGLPNLLERLCFSLHQLWPYPPQQIAWRLSSRFRPLSPWPARLPPRSAPTLGCAAAHSPLHPPRAGGAPRPASGPPLPPLSSSHSSHHARRAATHIGVGPCPVRTAPRCTARFPPGACAPSYLRLC